MNNPKTIVYSIKTNILNVSMTCSSSSFNSNIFLEYCQQLSRQLGITLISQSKKYKLYQGKMENAYTVGWLHIVQCACSELINKQSLIRRGEGSFKARSYRYQTITT